MIRLSLTGAIDTNKTEILQAIYDVLKVAGYNPTVLPNSAGLVGALTGYDPEIQDGDEFHLYNLFWRRLWQFEALHQEEPILSTTNAITDMAYQKYHIDKLVAEGPGLVIPGQPNIQQAKQAQGMNALQTMMVHGVYDIVTYWHFIYYCRPIQEVKEKKYQTAVDENIRLFSTTVQNASEKIRTVPDVDLHEYFTEQLEDWKVADATERRELGIEEA